MEYVHVGRFEITTEFRRVVRLEEKHALLNDAFGRGGLRDVEEALRPLTLRFGHSRSSSARSMAAMTSSGER